MFKKLISTTVKAIKIYDEEYKIVEKSKKLKSAAKNAQLAFKTTIKT